MGKGALRMSKPLTKERAQEIIKDAKAYQEKYGLYHINYTAVMTREEQESVTNYWFKSDCFNNKCFNDALESLAE